MKKAGHPSCLELLALFPSKRCPVSSGLLRDRGDGLVRAAALAARAGGQTLLNDGFAFGAGYCVIAAMA
jgi:hypothetical protein